MGWIWLLVSHGLPTLIKINSNLVRVENRTSCWDLEFYVLLLKEILLMGRNCEMLFMVGLTSRIIQAIFILIAVNSVKKYSEMQRHNLKHHFQYTCFLKIRRCWKEKPLWNLLGWWEHAKNWENIVRDIDW